LDGNKRTARACCVLFLKLNGIEPKDPPAEAGEAMVSLATGGWNEA
jgi:prophage maintenance system killer protein